ncbi:E3 ubiquitin-protein ligase TRIM21-like isoform X2 [Cyprinodon tularosa]|nr:E3 ubiquitin-protein ligase TRIM21-like isoform X2 [Cyprinodon tularosa]
MTTASCLLSEDQFRCFVCQNVFTDPVSTPCGHNFCKNCVTETSHADVPFQCPICQRMFFPKPELQVNTLIAELLDMFRRSAQRQNREPVRGDFFCRTRSNAFKIFLFCLFLIVSSQVKYGPHLKEEAKGKKPESPEENKLSAVHLEQLFTEVMKKEIPRLLIRAELMKAQRYAVDVTLDPDTLHPKLVLSADRKQVRCCDPQKNLPHDLKRFLYYKYVLGEQSFSSGRFYFEVQVKGKTNWTLGVAKESVKRVGLIRLRPQFGYWSLTVRNGKEYSGLSEPPVHFSLQSRPEKVGVFVDYGEGLVFFYDVDAAALIYSFTGCFFTERLHPFFGTGHNNNGTNGEPLIITAVRLPE